MSGPADQFQLVRRQPDSQNLAGMACAWSQLVVAQAVACCPHVACHWDGLDCYERPLGCKGHTQPQNSALSDHYRHQAGSLQDLQACCHEHHTVPKAACTLTHLTAAQTGMNQEHLQNPKGLHALAAQLQLAGHAWQDTDQVGTDCAADSLAGPGQLLAKQSQRKLLDDLGARQSVALPQHASHAQAQKTAGVGQAVDAWAPENQACLTVLVRQPAAAGLQIYLMHQHVASSVQHDHPGGANVQREKHAALQALGAQLCLLSPVGDDFEHQIDHGHQHVSEGCLQGGDSQESGWPIYWGSIGVTRRAQQGCQ